MTILVVTNTATLLARRRLPELRSALPESRRIRHQVTEHQAQADALLGHDGWQPDDLLVINGGDGSVQHALTVLQNTCPAGRWPRLACLPGGSTNMTAYDLNEHRRYLDCVTSLKRLAAGQSLAVAPRPVVRVRHAGATRCGLFFGMGTIVRGVEYFHARLRSYGGRHELTAGVALARTAWGIARHQPPFDEPQRARVGTSLWAGGGDRELSLRLLLATTLDRLFLGMRPYWGVADGPLRVTLVERRAAHFVSRLPRLLSGKPDQDMTPEQGYHSGRDHSLDLTFDGSYTLDGELFASGGDSMRVQSSDPVRFLPL